MPKEKMADLLLIQHAGSVAVAFTSLLNKTDQNVVDRT